MCQKWKLKSTKLYNLPTTKVSINLLIKKNPYIFLLSFAPITKIKFSFQNTIKHTYKTGQFAKQKNIRDQTASLTQNKGGITTTNLGCHFC